VDLLVDGDASTQLVYVYQCQRDDSHSEVHIYTILRLDYIPCLQIGNVKSHQRIRIETTTSTESPYYSITPE